MAFVLPFLLFFSESGSVAAQKPPQGAGLDEIIWMEERDQSEALTAVITGDADALTFDLTTLSDKERAHTSDRVKRFSTFGVIDNFLMNPSRQKPEFPRNPFAIDEVREAMQWLIDREFIAREIWGGFAIPRGGTMWHPRSPEYGRGIGSFLPLEEKYAFDPAGGRERLFTALQANGWSIGEDGLWHDPEGRLVTLRGEVRLLDARRLMGEYYAALLRGLNFDVVLLCLDACVRIPESGPYFPPPDTGLWHFYTAGWISSRIAAWEDGIPFFWSCGFGFEPYCAHRPEDTRNPNVYVVNQELADISDTLLRHEYGTLEERAMLIARATELAMRAPIRIFIDARESLFVFNNRFRDGIFDLFRGPLNPWFLRAATVPADTATGLRTAHVLNPLMFIDGWNPWQAAPGWRYDDVQRQAMTDPPRMMHPHTGRWIDFRTRPTVETAGPIGTLPVSDTAVVFDADTNAWVAVPATMEATSKVTLEFVLGNWHTGQPITMADVMYGASNGYRRVEGDVSRISGLVDTASGSEKFFWQDQVVGLDVVDASTLDVYLNFWHVDPQEIAGLASMFPPLPWEAAELALQTMFDLETANNEADAGATGRTWLDLTKGDSVPFLTADLATMVAAAPIPPGMDSTALPASARINVADAPARWNALDAFVTAKGHFWPSQGPFYLDEVDLPNRTTTMKAFREYPFRVGPMRPPIPDITVRNAPAFVLPGGKAVFDLMVTVAGSLDESVTVWWLLKDLSTREFVAEGIGRPVIPGMYRVELSSTLMDELEDGNFELIAVARGTDLAFPAIARAVFAIVPEIPDAFLYLCPDILNGCLDSSRGLGREVREIQDEVDRLNATLAGVGLWLNAVLILSSASLVMSTLVVIHLIQRRSGSRFR